MEASKSGAIEQAIRDAIPLTTLIRDLVGDAGHGITQAATRVASADPARLGPGQMASLIYYAPLANGTPTGMARRPDWEHNIHHHLGKIHGHRLAVAFARRVLQDLPDNYTTKEIYTAEALLELLDEARREVGE